MDTKGTSGDVFITVFDSEGVLSSFFAGVGYGIGVVGSFLHADLGFTMSTG